MTDDLDPLRRLRPDRVLPDDPNDPGTLAHMGQRARELARGYDRVNELDRFVRTVEEAARR